MCGVGPAVGAPSPAGAPRARLGRRRGRTSPVDAPIVEPVRRGKWGERASPTRRAEPANGGGEQRSERSE